MADDAGHVDGQPDDPEKRPHQAGFHRILVTDDEVGIRKGCQRVLRGEGHEVTLAETGEEGLEFLRRNPATDLALVDLRMPGLGGLEFLAQAREVAPETVTVVITAYATIETAVESTKRGAYDFLTKPFTPDELIRVVNKALQHGYLLRERNRLQAERGRRLLELATEQSRLRTIIDCMADGVLVCNAEGRLVLFNPAALRVLPRLEGHHEAQRLPEALEPPELRAMIDEASAGATRQTREVSLQIGGSETWALASVAPVRDARSAQFLGTVTVLRDITEMKRVEQVKAQFVNMVAHELRAPLAAVQGYLSVIQEGLVPDPAKQREMIGRSSQRLQSLLDLVSDLLDVSRMEAGAVAREIRPQDLGQILRDVADLMKPLAQGRRVTLEVPPAGEVPPVPADREELVRLFTNLASNAIKYNREGGRVTFALGAEGPYVKVTVADTGLGISGEGMAQLFTEFFREKRPETAYITGTGLGLSIVKRIVDLYHGRIEAQSVLGQGSTFTVWLPCRQERPLGDDSGPA